ncbi:lysostaphin resistance A-like protein [Paramicrobacterium sp. CJ85]|uniref:CPBP family intramembrane glutamic endopeptidase n=1 Tax=Paramicrobacterium sp. CJ85 TaxID=3445355 RepID=UPI003F62E720
MPTAARPRRTVAALAAFLATAFGLAWLVALPLWLSGEGLTHPWASTAAIVMMATPTLGALVAVFVIERPAQKGAALGLWPAGPPSRLWTYLGFGVAVPITLAFAALVVGALLGVYPADFAELSGLRQLLAAQDAGDPPAPLPLMIVGQFGIIVVGSVINMVPALGEEIGWRGWLLPTLLRLGTVPALLLSGAIWGLWHAPLVLLGYNYPTAPVWLAVPLMMASCIAMGAVLGWLRIRSGSVWPAALGHGAFNACAGLPALFVGANEQVDTVSATVLGWSGWIAPIVLVACLLAAGQFRAPASRLRRRRSGILRSTETPAYSPELSAVESNREHDAIS